MKTRFTFLQRCCLFFWFSIIFALNANAQQYPAVGDTLRGGVVISCDKLTGNVVILHPTENPPQIWTLANNWAVSKGAGWRQPTLSELQSIYANKTAINTGLSKVSGTTLGTSVYWSGSEYGAVDAWRFSFSNSGVNSVSKDYDGYSARAVLALNLFNNSILLPAGLAAENGATVYNTIASLNLDNGIQAANHHGPALGTDSYAGDTAGFAGSTDFRLQAASPCVGTGDVAKVPAGLTTDMYGNPFVASGKVNMGAFAQGQYTITATAGAHGSITPLGSSIVSYGSSIPYTITPDPGYRIDSVLVDEVNIPAAVSSGSYTFTNVTDNHTIRAVFACIPVVITTQPVSNIVCEGSHQRFSVAVVGRDSTFRWQKLNASAVWEDLTGGTSQTDSLVLNPVLSSDAGSYRVVVSGICSKDTSNAVTLTVTTLVTITAQPVGSVVCEGETHTFRVQASGAVSGYRWFRKGEPDPMSNGNILQTGEAGTYYAEVIGVCNSTKSAEATLTVNHPARITADLMDVSICEGSNYTFRPGISGERLTYQWYKGGNIIAGATGDTLEITNASFEEDYDIYQVEVSGACGEAVRSRTARLWVAQQIPQPILFEVPDIAYRGQSTRLHVGYEYGYNDVTDYIWSFGEPNSDTYAPNQQTVFVKFNTATDSQRVFLTMEHVCGPYEVYKDIQVEYPTGIEELELKGLDLFPVPFRNEVHIRGAEGCSLRVVSASGAVVYSKRIENADETILTGHWSEGVYLFRLEKDGKAKTVKGAKN